MKTEKKKGRAKRNWFFIFTTICTFLAVFAAGVFALFQMDRYEAGILEVCATQQDAYVQLVLDQIDLNREHADDALITQIIGVMDHSSNKYWTLSREQSMIFVKDVLETNRYKGFTAATYYISDSARAFLKNLRSDRVTHANIEIGEKFYVASGASFIYDDSTYSLCLLTNTSVLLDNNKFLGAKSELGTLIAVLLLAMVIVVMLATNRIRKLLHEQDSLNDNIGELNNNVTQLNKLLLENDLHDTRNNVWSPETMGDFIQKLKARKAYPSTLVKVSIEDVEEANKLLRMAGSMLDKTVLRFEEQRETESIVSFLFIQSDENTALQNLQPLLTSAMKLESTQKLEDL